MDFLQFGILLVRGQVLINRRGIYAFNQVIKVAFIPQLIIRRLK